MYKQKGKCIEDRYSYSPHSNGTTIKNMFGDTIAIIDCNERLSFITGTTPLVKQEVKDFLDNNDIPYIL